MAKVFTIPVTPSPKRKQGRRNDARYLEGQRVLVDAMRHLAQDDPQENREAIDWLFEHFRTQFRMSDSPLREP